MMLAVDFTGGQANDLFRLPNGEQTRWYSPENPNGKPGQGGKTNRGGKGRAWIPLKAGESLTILDVKGAGTVDRMWFTLRERDPAMLRSLKIEMFWDGATKPAVSAPFGDFFCLGLAKLAPFENALFSSPEGRSFNCVVPMPFRKGARITVTNEGEIEQSMTFYDVDVTHRRSVPADAGYFHAFWNRTPKVPLGVDYEILPKVEGKGRYLGVNFGAIGDPLYAGSGWCEGEFKAYLDDDTDLPTLVGTGTEDYMGTGWGLNTYSHRYQGSTLADDAANRWSFYRLHVPDPVYFERAIRLTLQDMGGDELANVRKMVANGAKLVPVTVAAEKFHHILDDPAFPKLDDPAFPNGWVNFYRSDDFCSLAYFYLDRPTSNLPELPPVEERIEGI